MTATVTMTADRDGLVATILVDRSAKLNALTLETLAELEDRLDTIAGPRPVSWSCGPAGARSSASGPTSERSPG